MGGIIRKELDQDLKAILQNALKDRASTIHIEDTDKYILVRFRVDRRLIVVNKLPKSNKNLILNLINWADINKLNILDEARQEFEGNKLRINVIPNIHGYKATINILTNYTQHKLTDFGLWGNNLKEVQQTIGDGNGIIIISGNNDVFSSSISRVIKNILVENKQTVAKINHGTLGELKSALARRYDAYEINLNSIEEVELISDRAKTSLFILKLNSSSRMDLISKLKILRFFDHKNLVHLKTTLHYKTVKKHCTFCCYALQQKYSSVKLVESALGINTKVTLDDIEKYKKVVARELELDSTEYRESAGCEKCHFTGYLGDYGLFEALKLKVNKDRVSLVRMGETIEIDGLIKALLGVIDLKDIISPN